MIEEKFERRVIEEHKKPYFEIKRTFNYKKHEKIIDETLDEFSESEFLKKVNQVYQKKE